MVYVFLDYLPKKKIFTYLFSNHLPKEELILPIGFHKTSVNDFIDTK